MALVVVGAAEKIAAVLADELAFMFDKTIGTIGAIDAMVRCGRIGRPFLWSGRRGWSRLVNLHVKRVPRPG